MEPTSSGANKGANNRRGWLSRTSRGPPAASPSLAGAGPSFTVARTSSRGVEGTTAAPHVTGQERFEGYYALCRDLVTKGVTLEEAAQRSTQAGLPQQTRERRREALHAYQQALTVLGEALAYPEFSLLSGASQKLAELASWQENLRERVRVLGTQTPALSSSTAANLGHAGYTAPTPPNHAPPSRRASATASAVPSGKARSRESANAPAPKSGTSAADAKLREVIEAEIVAVASSVRFDDIAGNEAAKQALQEMIILPSSRPDLFRGLRAPARGLLLFGPPGNGKTLLAKAVASEANCTFFSISASSLTSKFMGEGEKLVRTLFQVAAERQPSVVFIDEIDSVLSARSSEEHEASRRLKTEFLVQFDGVLSGSDSRVIIMGATNRPEELDEAVRRRLVKRIYIRLPDKRARLYLLKHMLKDEHSAMSKADFNLLASNTEYYSGSDLAALCKEAAMGPVRELGPRIANVSAGKVRPIDMRDFRKALRNMKPSLSAQDLRHYEEFNEQYGSAGV